MTPDELEQWRERRREYNRKWRATMTAEKRARRNEKRRAYNAKWYANRTAEQIERARVTAAKFNASRSPEQRARDLECNRRYNARKAAKLAALDELALLIPGVAQIFSTMEPPNVARQSKRNRADHANP